MKTMITLSFCSLFITQSLFAVGFKSGTQIALSKTQTTTIESIAVGHSILSAVMPGFCHGRVIELIREQRSTLKINLENGDSLECSSAQILYSTDGGWVRAKDLETGMKLQGIEDEIKVINVKAAEDIATSCTFEVMPTHTFYANGILCHNPYGLGQGPYGQSYAGGHNNHTPSQSVPVPPVARDAAIGCVGGVGSGLAGGEVHPRQIAKNCFRGAAGGVSTRGAANAFGD